MKPSSFLSPALILSLGTFGSYLLGVLRDLFFARTYGANYITDAYFSAFIIPDIMLMICVSSALLGIAIPLFMETRRQNTHQGYTLYGVFFSSIQTFFIFISLLGIIFTPEIFSFLYPQIYSQNPDLLIHLAQIFFASNLFFGISNFLGSFLMAHQHFFSTALAPLFYNIGILLGILFFADEYGIYAAAFGAFIGSLAHLASRLIEYFYHTERFPLAYDWKNPQLQRLLSSMVLRWITVAALPFVFFSFTQYASLTQEGLYSIFFYARNLESAPVMIFGIAITSALFPLLSQKFAENKSEEMVLLFWNGVYKIVFWTVPIATGIFFLGSLFLGYIYDLSDDREKMQWLSSLILILAFVIPFEALSSLLARTFNAMGNTKTPLYIAVISVTATLACLSFFYYTPLYSPASVIGISYFLGFFISVCIGFLFLFFDKNFQKQSDRLFFPFINITRNGMFLSLSASIAMVIGFLFIQKHSQNTLISSSDIDVFIYQLLIPAIIISSLFFIFIALFWKKDLLRNFKHML